jgi:hypothetical protein
MDQNKQLLTVDDLFRLQGRQPGWSPTDLEFDQAVKTVEALNKEKLAAMMMPEQQMPKYMSLTNEADGSVVRGIMEQGKFREIPVDKVNTQQGMFSMSNPTNAVPLVDPRTGQQLQGYAADPMMGGAPSPAPLAGGGMMATNSMTNAPAAAPMQTPAPSPTPFPEGAVIRSKRDGQNYRIVNGQPVLVGP